MLNYLYDVLLSGRIQCFCMQLERAILSASSCMKNLKKPVYIATSVTRVADIHFLLSAILYFFFFFVTKKCNLATIHAEVHCATGIGLLSYNI